MVSEDFYAHLPAWPDFDAIARPESYRELPHDWHVLITDVQGSTEAIRAGRYKDVNLLGASSIIAVINAVKPLQAPFVFGGDGASICVPPSALGRASEALAATRELAASEFGLTLRAGAVPVGHIVEAGHRVLVAKIRLSDSSSQAAFSGGGLQYAEQCIKDPTLAPRFSLDRTAPASGGDFTGLECRWNSIPSPRGEIVSLLVQATSGSAERDARTYREVIAEIGRIYGEPDVSRPVSEAGLTLGLSVASLDGETRVRAGGRSWLRKLAYRTRIHVETAIGVFLIAVSGRLGGVHWGRYKQQVIANTDFRKFDDRLRQVLSGNAEQRGRLGDALEKRCRRGELAYGLHAAPTALMTCLIFERSTNQHVHFIDGADGGYGAAAVDLKRRLESRSAARQGPDVQKGDAPTI